MDGFEAYREAARRAIEASGGEAVLVEDFPSLPVSSRNACLDGVASCDLYLAVIGERGGWTAPSGKLVVEEEFEEAQRRGRLVMVLIQDSARDNGAERLARRLSDYVDGFFRQTFTTPDELYQKAQRALEPRIRHFQEPMIDTTIISAQLDSPRRLQNEVNLRFVLIPERGEEMLDPVQLESQELKYQLYELGSARDVQLLSHERRKETRVTTSAIIIEQADSTPYQTREGKDEVRIEINLQGVVTVDVNVTGRQASDWRGMGHLALLEGDIVEGLRRCFAFCNAFYQKWDPFKRYNRFFFNAALNGIGYRPLLAEPSTGNSMGMRMAGPDAVTAFAQPRLLTRQNLQQYDEQVQHALVMFRRHLRT